MITIKHSLTLYIQIIFSYDTCFTQRFFLVFRWSPIEPWLYHEAQSLNLFVEADKYIGHMWFHQNRILLDTNNELRN